MQSVQRVVSDGTLQIVDLRISYFDRSEISVYINSELYTAWQWASDVEDRIVFNEPIPDGVEVLIKRTTDLSKLRHYFSKGSAFTAEALDEDLQQVLHIAQEATESSLVGDFYTDIDMHGHRVRNISPAVDDSDALTLRQYKQDAQGAWVARNQAERFKNEAASYASSAQTSANNSAASAQDSLAAAGSAQTYATSAAASASAAAQSATNAAASATAAAQSATNAAASFDAFDDRYLGAKPSDPVTDNDGNALQVGALYWNTTANEMRVWNGLSWQASAGSLVGNVTTATRLQTARTLTIGNTGKSFDGSADVSWSLDEIGAARFGAIVDGTNLNTVIAPGFYRLFGYPANAPAGVGDGQLIVARGGGDTILQIVTGYGNGEIYWRQGNPPELGGPAWGSWGPWYRFFHSGNINTANAGTATRLQTARTLTIGSTSKSFDGSADASWSLADILGNGVPGTAQELGSGVDLNTIQTPGFYWQPADVNASSGANYPVPYAGALMVLKNTTGVTQIYYLYGHLTTMFFRGYYNTQWSPWREVYHSGTPALPLGVGQTWQNVTAWRAANTTYTNTTGRPIEVAITYYNHGNNAAALTFIVNGVIVGRFVTRFGSGEKAAFISAIVPAGASYSVSNAEGTLFSWAELR